MTITKRTNEERNIKRVVLLGSTFVVLLVSIIIAYLLINSEIKSARDEIKSFENTLIEREKFSIKDIVENLINDIEYEKASNNKIIKTKVKNQAQMAYNLALSIANQNHEKSKEKIIEIIKALINATIYKDSKINYFIFDNNGTLLLNTQSNTNEGENYIDTKDIDGKKFVEQIINTIGYVEYSWYRPNYSQIVKKITYSKKIKSLGITIGSIAQMDYKQVMNEKIIKKIEKENFTNDEFLFLFNIKNLNNLKEFSHSILNKNITVGSTELDVIYDILISTNYKANVFTKYNNRLIYSTYLPKIKTFISAGAYLDSINKVIEDKTMKLNEKLNEKILSLVILILVITFIFFVLSYVLANKIERMFKNYRLKIANSQQLLIQKSKMASMGEMIGNIAHQWRQPLSQLSGLFFDIESAYDYKELNKKYLLKRSDEANDLIEYMSKTIDDFKEFYNPNTNKEIFNVSEIVNSALKIISSSLEYHNISVKIDVDKSLYANGFSNEFAQVIVNILSNSKDIALIRDIESPKIEIYTQYKDGYTSLHVEDNCGGIDEDIIEKIFDPYFTTKYDYGTGIGLYMCKVIIENKMGGKIFATNLKSGSRFTMEGLYV